jgi:predicted metal-dependent hydrolase
MYKITRTNRKTIAIYVRKNGEVEVRAPLYISDKKIQEFVKEKEDWITKTQNKIKQKIQNKQALSIEEANKLIDRANEYIPQRVIELNKQLKSPIAKIKITGAKTYWGCCNGKNEVSFSWRLMLADNKTIDYVIIHELVHTIHHNHSKAFWQEVGKIIPDYKESKERLQIIHDMYDL